MTKEKKKQSGYAFLPPVIHELYAVQLPDSWESVWLLYGILSCRMGEQ